MQFLRARNCLILVQRGVKKLIETSPYSIGKIPNTTLPEFLFKDLSKYKNKPAITCGVTERTWNYGQLKSLTNKMHCSLKKTVGLQEGDVVGLILPNAPEFPPIVFGALQGGLRVTFINPIFTPEEIIKQFVDAEVKCIVAKQDNKTAVDQIARKLKGYMGTIYLDDNGGWEFNGKSLSDAPEEVVEKLNIDPDNIAILPYSSGTTGVPKGVMLSHYTCVANIVQITAPEINQRSPTTDEYQDRVLTVIPFYHIYGFNGIMNYCIEGGSHIITMPKFIPEHYIDCLKKYKPTMLFTVPSLLLFMASHPDIKTEHLQTIRKVTTGAAPATRSLIEKFKAKVQRDDISIVQGYGLTETSPVVLLTPSEMPDSKTGSAGVLVPATDARIVCIETGKDLPKNQPGELCIKGPQVMKGYLKNEEATKRTIDDEGWMHTGDVAYYDEDGYFYIVDRCKELIKCKGNQVSPTEVEGIIMELDQVADVAVIGIPHEKWGEVPKAFIVLKQNKKLTADEINSFVNPRLAAYKHLTGGISFIDLIPRNHAGKIMRKQLQSMT